MGTIDTDIRNQPSYTLAEASRYLKVAPATLRDWFVGRRSSAKGNSAERSRPLIKPSRNPPPVLSFYNLIEAHVLRSLRIDHSVRMNSLRRAIEAAQKQFNIERLLLHPDLRTDAGKLLLERYGQLIDLSASGQIAMRHMFSEHLARVEWDEWKFPVRLYPFSSSIVSAPEDRAVSIAANIAFGRPVLASSGITTEAIAGRIDCGETIENLAADYDLSTSDIEQAVCYERAA
jgi:uncharacterized protein (DUF433 family)